MTTTLITGGAGFVGSHVTELLLAQGQHVVVLDDFSTGSPGNLPRLANAGLEVVHGDVRDRETVSELVARVDRVVHLAAAVGAKLVVDDPVEAMSRNIEGSMQVLRACVASSRPVLCASSSEVYGKSTALPFGEAGDLVLRAPTSLRWSYAASKIVGEFLALAHAARSGLPVINVRLFNTAGARQLGRYGMVIPRFVEQALRGQPITVHGDGSQRRCFCHVRDAAAALIALLETSAANGEVVNIGGRESISINDLAARVKEMTASPSPIIHLSAEDAYREGFTDMPDRRPDLSKARALIGFEPRLGIDEILRDLVEFSRHSWGPAPT